MRIAISVRQCTLVRIRASSHADIFVGSKSCANIRGSSCFRTIAAVPESLVCQDVITLQSKNISAFLVGVTLTIGVVLGGCSSNSGQSAADSAQNTTTPETSTTTGTGSTATATATAVSPGSGTTAQSGGAAQSTTTKPGNSVTTSTGSSKTGTNNTASSGVISFSTATFTTQHVTGEAVVTVARQAGSYGPVTVNYSTSDGTAVQGTDYTATQGTLTWEDGDDQPKTIAIAIPQSDQFSGTKQFVIRLSDPSAPASLGSPSVSTVVIAGTLATKSISAWVKCDGTDDSQGTAAALSAAKNNAFALVIDCPIRIHFSADSAQSLVIEDGTTIEFQGSGAVTIDNVSPPPLQVPHPSNVTLINWNVNYP
jgi:hypothetical protein